MFYKIGRLFDLSIINSGPGPSFLASVCVVDYLLDGMNDGEITTALKDVPDSLIEQKTIQASKQPCTR